MRLAYRRLLGEVPLGVQALRDARSCRHTQVLVLRSECACFKLTCFVKPCHSHSQQLLSALLMKQSGDNGDNSQPPASPLSPSHHHHPVLLAARPLSASTLLCFIYFLLRHIVNYNFVLSFIIQEQIQLFITG